MPAPLAIAEPLPHILINIDNLIEDYKVQTKIYADLDNNYSDKSSVRKMNNAVDRMYQIVGLISENNRPDEVAKFSELLIEKENKTNLWAAVHLLEKLKYEKRTGKDALKIIEKVANGNDSQAMGFQYWLKEFKLK